MAVYTPQRAADIAKQYIKNMRWDTAVQVRICDTAAQELWMAAPWRWTIGSLANVTITPGTQDHSFTKPADFLYLSSAYIWDSTTRMPLEVVSYIPPVPTTDTGQAVDIAYVSSSGDKLRLGKIPATASSGHIVALYKKTYTEVTSGTMATVGAHGVPDEWSFVYQSCVLYHAMKYADDPKAGGATVMEDKIQYSGQYGIYKAELVEMRRAEKVLLDFPGVRKDRG